MVPGLLVQDADPSADGEALERLALWIMQRFAPVAAADPPDGIVIDSKGTDHLHGGEAAMLEGLVGRLAMSGILSRAAVADTWGAAHALARYRTDPVTIAPPGHGAAAIASLPLEALRIAPAVAADLRVLGFERVEAARRARSPTRPLG
jgi:protein ImuB